jgi:hypothetical protein
VLDCSLDKLHEHIQTSMGWTNSHLHDFTIDGQRYGDPRLLDDGFGNCDFENSLTTKISDVLPRSGKRLKFSYHYDFGDCWEHDIVFEGNPASSPSSTLPLCIEGERACPPEDVGGVWGFGEYLDALCDPTHENHEELLEWSGPFDPEDFNATDATNKMRRGTQAWY